MDIEQLKLLADNGTPLALTTEMRGENLWVSRDGGEPVELYRQYMTQKEDALESALAHYPREVTINGAVLPTIPAPRAARVKMLEPTGYDISRDPVREFRPGAGPEGEPISRRHNAIVGGVCCYLRLQIPDWERDENLYLSPMEGPHPRHHRLLMAVHLEAHTEITTPEISELREDRGCLPAVPRDSGLDHRVQERRQAMRAWTESLPGMPVRYPGDVYIHPTGNVYIHSTGNVYIHSTGNDAGHWVHEGAPIAVMGTPVCIDGEELDLTNAEMVSLVDAL